MEGKSRMRRLAVLMFAGVVSLAGCGKFFTPPSTGGGGSGSSGNNLYVANSQSATATIAGFAVGTSALSVLNKSPYAGAVGATCIALTPNNNFLYVGTGTYGIFVYTVNSDGSLTLANNSIAVATGIIPSSIVVDPSGSWLIVSDQLGQQLLSYSINTTTGVLTNLTTNHVALSSDASTHMAITPNGEFIYVPVGTAGVDIISFNSTTGSLTAAGSLVPLNAQGADQAVATDPNGTYLFVAETGSATNLGLRQLTIGTNGALTEVNGSPFATGVGPSAILVDATGGYVYVANSTSGTITGYSLSTTGTLAAISGSPYTAGKLPVNLVEDNTKSYIAVVDSGGTPDLQLYKFDATTPGKLDPVATATTGTDPTFPLAVAATH
jgi:6-phosphogluconolactonase (cycloisomerase 2 family)